MFLRWVVVASLKVTQLLLPRTSTLRFGRRDNSPLRSSSVFFVSLVGLLCLFIFVIAPLLFGARSDANVRPSSAPRHLLVVSVGGSGSSYAMRKLGMLLQSSNYVLNDIHDRDTFKHGSPTTAYRDLLLHGTCRSQHRPATRSAVRPSPSQGGTQGRILCNHKFRGLPDRILYILPSPSAAATDASGGFGTAVTSHFVHGRAPYMAAVLNGASIDDVATAWGLSTTFSDFVRRSLDCECDLLGVVEHLSSWMSLRGWRPIMFATPAFIGSHTAQVCSFLELPRSCLDNDPESGLTEKWDGSALLQQRNRTRFNASEFEALAELLRRVAVGKRIDIQALDGAVFL